MFLLVPYRAYVPTTCRPWTNYAVMAVTIIISVLALGDDKLLMDLAGIDYGNLLDEPEFTSNGARYPILSLTSSLVHADYWHLGGNMLFLWVFGNAVNYKFGHLRYLGLYALSALVSGMAHYTLVGGAAVGASGAIFGVMGAFLVYFPRNDLEIFWMVFVRMGTKIISSGWMIAFWVGWNLLMLKLDRAGNIALWAHIGGFAAGFATAVVCLKSKWITPDQDEQTLFDLFGRK